MLKALISSKIYLALAAFLWCLESQVQLGMPLSLQPYLLVVFFATLLVYNVPKISVMLKRPPPKKAPGFFVFVALTLAGLGLSLLKAHSEILLCMVPLGALTLWYSVPLRLRRKTIKLRTLPYAKIFVISAVWSLASAFVPFIHPSCTQSWTEFSWIFLERFLFMFALLIPFDIRDMASDQKNGLRTLPLLLGERRAQKISYALLWVFIALAIIHEPLATGVALVSSSLLTMLMMRTKALAPWPFYYGVLLDGMIIVQSLLVLATNLH